MRISLLRRVVGQLPSVEPVHESAEPMFGEYGTPERGISVVQAFDPVEVEYAAVRRHAAVFDQPHTGVLEFRGPDRASFLNRMLSQNLADLGPGWSRNSFLLDRKGRIAADLRVVQLAERTLALGEVFAVERAKEALDKYIIAEDVTVADLTGTHHVLSVHGPAAAAIVAGACDEGSAGVAEIAAGSTLERVVAGAPAVIERQDWCGEIGLTLVVEAARAKAVYGAVSTPWSARGPGDAAAQQTALARRVGWHALNIARIEAGTAVYMLDFGPDSLPHETGDATLADRVSFKKGCYLGQEIVARMQSLGHPKQKLVGLRASGSAPGGSSQAQATTGTAVLESAEAGAAVVGAVTSSAFSPMNSGEHVCFAMVKWSFTAAGKVVYLDTGGEPVAATVQAGLSFLKRT
ncbi:MAG: YgfZ/GcvT domain-containing protein [Phycisphaerales bacterium]